MPTSFGHQNNAQLEKSLAAAAWAVMGKDAQDILSERYGRGEIIHEEYGRMKAAISA